MVKRLRSKHPPNWLKLEEFCDKDVFFYYGNRRSFSAGAQVIWQESNTAYSYYCTTHSLTKRFLERREELDCAEFIKIIEKIELLNFKDLKRNTLFRSAVNVRHHYVGLKTHNIPLTFLETMGLTDMDRTAQRLNVIAQNFLPDAHKYLADLHQP